MSKTYSQYLKGIAILMMVFLHLFMNQKTCMNLETPFTIDGIPLVYYITRMTNPVAFYLILSGYGLYSLYTIKGGGKIEEATCQPISSSLDHIPYFYSDRILHQTR